MNISKGSSLENAKAHYVSLEKKMTDFLTLEISAILKNPENEHAFYRGGLFTITKKGIGTESITYNWLPPMKITLYKQYKKIVIDEINEVDSPTEDARHSEIVSTIVIGQRILILVGLEEPLAQMCLLVAAIKYRLLTQEQAKETTNFFLKRNGLPELQLNQA